MKLKIATITQDIEDLQKRNEKHKIAIRTNNNKLMKLEIELQKAENYTPKPAGKWQGNGMSDETIEALRKKV